MFKIGDFSKFSRVSIKMLRHYDDLGLLKPARVDTGTGYRYYTADQLPRLNRIITLKDLGFSLEQIAGLLGDDLSADELRGMLKLKRAEAQQRLCAEQMRIAQIDAQLYQLDNEAALPRYDVVLRDVPGGIYATQRATVVDVDGDDVQFMFEEVETYVAHYNARAPKPPLTIYHDADYHDENQDIEVAIPVNAAIPGSECVTVREVPGCEMMACVVHTGSYATIHHASTALIGWIGTHGYDIAGPMREVYLRFGADEVGFVIPDVYLAKSSAEFVTELQIPVSKPSS